MVTFDFDDLNKQAKIGYNALYNVVFQAIGNGKGNGYINSYTIPLCLNSDNKVLLTEKNFIFFESVFSELKIIGDYTITNNCGRAVEDVKTDYSTVTIYWTDSKKSFDEFSSKCEFKHFDFSAFDTSKLLKRDGKAEKAKTAENTAKKEEEAKTAEEEVKNEEKVMQRKADALNADTVATIYETTIRRIGLILGVKWEDMDKKQKNAIKDALKDHVKMLENGSVM